MTRYYYTCPIKAAYMAKEFGVKFEQWLYPTIHSTIEELCEVSFLKIIREIEFHQQNTNKGKFRNRYIVAPASENIFKPLQGDLGIERNLHSTETCYFGGKYWAYENEEKQTTPHQQRVKIIYRDGTEFFMAEVEND